LGYFLFDLFLRDKVAVIGFVTGQHRPEYPYFSSPVTQGNGTNGFAVGLQGKRAAHSGIPVSCDRLLPLPVPALNPDLVTQPDEAANCATTD